MSVAQCAAPESLQLDWHLWLLLINEHYNFDLFTSAEMQHFKGLLDLDDLMSFWRNGDDGDDEDQLISLNDFRHDRVARQVALNVIVENSGLRPVWEYIDPFNVWTNSHDSMQLTVQQMMSWGIEPLMAAACGDNFVARHVAIRLLRDKHQLHRLKSQLLI